MTPIKKQLLRVETALAGSDSFHSIESERAVCELLRKNNWLASHSYYYKDIHSNKYREIDVFGRQVWCGPLELPRKSVAVDLVIEIKSIRGFHLLFSPLPPKASAMSHIRHSEVWLGYIWKHHKRIELALLEYGYSKPKIKKTLQMLEGISYPNGIMRNREMRIEMPTANCISTAFRETNIGSEKDIDNSVLWRANRAVASVIESHCDAILQVGISSLIDWIEFDKSNKERTPKHFIEEFEQKVSAFHYFHPIIVLESQLWSIEKGEPRSIEWCRFLQNGTGSPTWWIDVVNIQYFEKYLTYITEHYCSQFEQKELCPSLDPNHFF